MTHSQPRATVIIPTFNGEEYLPELLDALDVQEDQSLFEILFVDSGSTDSTLDLIRAHPRAKLTEIPNAEFGHGRTRNMAARMATTEFVLFLTQDAVPGHEHWVEEMLRPFDEIGERLVCVFGKQLPRLDCCPTVKRDLLAFFDSLGPDHCISIQVKSSPKLSEQRNLDALGFFSDVNSAVRRKILVDEIPYEDVDYAEDQVFGRAVIEAGYMKAYAPLGAVWHSHSYPPVMYLRRMYDEFAGLRRATGQRIGVSIPHLLFGWIRPTVGDWRQIRRDRQYMSLTTTAKWVVQAPIYNIFRRVAMRVAASSAPSPRLARWLSLEDRQRRAA